jgi:hypothetical protein
MNNKIITTINVKENLIGVMRVNDKDYISLTDLARYKNESNPGDVIIKWMSNKSSFDFYCLWEELFNEDFKLAESREFKNESANQSFTMSPSRWISMTNAKGFISKRGKYNGGTFAHPDIALEFASWIDPAFKLYLIREFERLKISHTKAFILVENATWENILNGKYNSKMTPQSLLSSILAWVSRYNVVPIFCKAETTPRMIRELLYREAREILEKMTEEGETDGIEKNVCEGDS